MKHAPFFAIAIGLCAGALTFAHADEPPRQNVIVFLVDDVGYADIGPFGAKGIQTPHLDRMAAEGMRLTDFYVHPVCGVTRASFMTGCYAMRVAEVGNRKHGHPILHPSERTIAELMKQAGYATGMIGKWHLAGDGRYPAELLPNAQGFDYWFGSPSHNGNHRTIEGGRFRMQLMRNGALVDDAVDQDEMDQITRRYTDEAIGFIRKHREEPFFLYVAHNMAHVVLGASEDFRGSSERGLYGDAMQELDWSAGRIMETLREFGIAGNTLMLFTSDNGPWVEDHLAGKTPNDDHYGRTTPLRGHKMTTWEGGVRVPTIAWQPGRVPAGKTCAEPMMIADLFPTCAALAGAALPDDRIIDGRDIGPLLFGEAGARSPHDAIYYYSYTHLQAVRSGDWKLVLQRPAKPPWGSWSARMTTAVKKNQLYQLREDISEQRDVAQKHPEVAARLMALVEQARADLGDYDRIGDGARFAEPGPTRPEAKKWIAGRASKEKRPGVATPPNFIIVFADDLGYADVGCFGSQQIRTPNIDRLASEGMRFTSFYAQPICGPSRAALMTGCYPLRIAERGNLKRNHPAMHSREITIAEVLKSRGYATACFGKWDVALHTQRDFQRDLMPNHQGFDYFFGTPSSNDSIVNLYRNGQKIKEKADMSLLTRQYTAEAISFIERHRDEPFFVYLPHTMPHVLLGASKQFAGKSQRGLYGDVVEEIDHGVGRIVETLRRLNLDDRTVILFTSDNGPWLSENKNRGDGTLPGDRGGSAGPLRSGKVTTWEGGIRVPTVVWAPKRVPAGATCNAIASTLDVMPTFAKLAGAKTPDDRVIDGEDISDLLAGRIDRANPEKTFFGYLHAELQTVRQGKWKLHLPSPEGYPVKNRHIAPADERTFRQPQLFDLETDLGEKKNVANQHPDVVEWLTKLAERARADIGDFDRIGQGARFFDEGPRRPDVGKPKRL